MKDVATSRVEEGSVIAEAEPIFSYDVASKFPEMEQVLGRIERGNEGMHRSRLFRVVRLALATSRALTTISTGRRARALNRSRRRGWLSPFE
jgi:hypothetical protein